MVIVVWCMLGLIYMATADAAARPHIIFILADDLAWGDVSYHSDESSSLIRTPNIDALAAEGIRLENYYVQPMCTPSRSQLMSGRYQIHTGLLHHLIRCGQELCHPLDDKFLPEYLKDYNYTTHSIGKWHLGMYRPGCLPTNRGFDTHFGVLTGTGDYYSHEFTCRVTSRNLRKRKLAGKDFRFMHPGAENDRIQERYEGNYTTEVYVERAKDIIGEYRVGSAAGSLPPLFLYVAFHTPHGPLVVPDNYRDLYDESPMRGKRKTHAGMVSALDNAVGEIVGALRAAGIYNDSVIIFSTDNGGHPSTYSSNWPLRGWKFTMWEGGIRAVGVIASPKYIPKCYVGAISRDLMHISDWLPTIVEGALGETIATPSDPKKSLDGFNVWDYFTKCQVGRTIRDEILLNIDPFYTDEFETEGVLRTPTVFHTGIHAGLRVGHMKILTGPQGRMDRQPPSESGLPVPVVTLRGNQLVRLFNVTADPYEQIDLAFSEPAIVANMLAKLSAYWVSDKRTDVAYPPQVLEGDPQLRDGYWSPWRNDDESLIVETGNTPSTAQSAGIDNPYLLSRLESTAVTEEDTRSAELSTGTDSRYPKPHHMSSVAKFGAGRPLSAKSGQFSKRRRGKARKIKRRRLHARMKRLLKY